MCLIAFAYKTHPKYRLVLIANRDEFYDRPTRSAQYWKDEGHPDIIGGKDLEAGGMWMGIHSDGRFSALTNYRDPSIQRTHQRNKSHHPFCLLGLDARTYPLPSHKCHSVD